MRNRIRRVAELVHIKSAGDLGRETCRYILIIFRMTARHVRTRDADFGAERAHVEDFFLGHFIGNDEQDAIAFRTGNERETEAGVASGCLDHRAAGLQFSFALSRLDHGERDAVLD